MELGRRTRPWSGDIQHLYVAAFHPRQQSLLVFVGQGKRGRYRHPWPLHFFRMIGSQTRATGQRFGRDDQRAVAGLHVAAGAVLIPAGREVLQRVSCRDGSVLDGGALASLDEARRRYQSHWGQPFWLPEARSAVVWVRTPIREGNRFTGMPVSGVTVRELSRFIARSGNIVLADNRFILYGTRTGAPEHEGLRLRV